MDSKWFKSQQKIAGVTADDIARIAGRSRSNVSHIYAGNQRMSLEWAQAFAQAFNLPVSEILKHAGVVSEDTAQKIHYGFAEGDAATYSARKEGSPHASLAKALNADRPGIDMWQVKSAAMSLQGYLPKDMMLVDTHAAERCRAGDVVIAQVYNWNSGDAKTVLRRFEPPVLVAANTDADDMRVLVVDGNNVVIKGKVIASWRIPDANIS